MENAVDFLSKIKCETVISVWNVKCFKEVLFLEWNV